MTKCISCQSELEFAFDDAILACPKCGEIQTPERTKIENHYMSCVNIDQINAKSKLIEWCSNQDNISRDFMSKASAFKFQLIFFPFWILQCDANSSFQAYHEIAEYKDKISEKSEVYRHVTLIPKLIIGEFSKEYEISIAGNPSFESRIQNLMISKELKIPFNHTYVQENNGVILHSKLSEQHARTQVEKIVNMKQTNLLLEKHRSVKYHEDSVTILNSFLIHVPIWKIEYNYANETFESFIDAGTGSVIGSDYPRSMENSALTGFSLILLTLGGNLLILGVTGIAFFLGLTSGSILTIAGFYLIYRKFLT